MITVLCFHAKTRLVSSEQWQFRLDTIFAFGVGKVCYPVEVWLLVGSMENKSSIQVARPHSNTHGVYFSIYLLLFPCCSYETRFYEETDILMNVVVVPLF